MSGCSSNARQTGATAAATATSTSASSTTALPPTTTTPSTPASNTPTSSKPPGEGFAFGETVAITNQGQLAAELTIDRPVEFASTNPYTKPVHGRFVYVPITFKVTGSVPIPVESADFEAVLPDGDIEFHLFMSSRPATVPAEFDETTVKPGETLVGSVVFDVPKDVELKIAYAPVLKNIGVCS